MVWNKQKKQMEDFLSPKVKDRVDYIASGYRYTSKKSMTCYMTVDKQEVFKMTEKTVGVNWYLSEQDAKTDTNVRLYVTQEEKDSIQKASGGKIPEERLDSIARNRKMSVYAKNVMQAQASLLKSDFQKTSTVYLAQSIDKSLESDDILLNIFALIDRRVGKKRLQSMRNEIDMKHPLVRYFYQLRM